MHLVLAHAVLWLVLTASHFFSQSFQSELGSALGVSVKLWQDSGDVEVGVVLFPILAEDVVLFAGPLWLCELDVLVEA